MERGIFMKIKKFLGFIGLAVLVILPLRVKAAEQGIKVEKSTQGDYTVVTLKYVQSGGQSVSSIPISMTMQNAELVEGGVIPQGTWVVQEQSATGITFVSSTPITDAEFTVATFTFRKTGGAQDKCQIDFKYGNQTEKVPVGPSTPENPKTGNVLPYAVIVAGIVVAGGVYYITRKNTKLYKI